MLALDVPPISHLVRWENLFGTSGPLGINKVVLLTWLAVIIVAVFFFSARKRQLVPSGSQNLAEAVIDFIRNDIILQTMGNDGLYWTPFLLTLFSFIFVCNIFEIIPAIQMPVTARMAIPFFMTMLVYFIYHFIGIKSQGVGGYFKSMLFPPGVPKALYLLVSPIEFITYFFTRPLSLAVRLFANLLAGHLLLTTFAVLTAALFSATYIGAIVPGSLLVALYGFEVLVAVLQAFIFTILTAVYIGGAMHPEH
ncbi:MAG: F0F1 ATP synthase subunit A [Acidimicrobiia bacterium]|nr:F0F1 ATP synthase subunit A [Acidimicrobiia bacterium]MBV8296302.1 F0F1 ATP synthase subunit A [Acidimicrobiia bacterium]MBV8302580.1 F0F1 ATP synthase subunit A [Acidimicrobiia bacterium]MBV8560665.1 F0F1 ATP synthase subunit A [Acidimicrobiia bacterium]